MSTLTIKDIGEFKNAAVTLLEGYPLAKLFTFSGVMGVGKTTFIKAICEQLGVIDNTSSPTFSIINEYIGSGGQKIYHFDFYRIKSIEEVYDIGYEDYFYSDSYCFIEWPEKITELLPDNAVNVNMAVKDGERIITF